MKTVITYGVFDYFHLGHLRLFKNIRKTVGEPCRLIVAMQSDEQIMRAKPTAKPVYSTAERIEMLSSIREIDEVVIYNLVDEDLKLRDFDILAVGPDQNSEYVVRGKYWALENGKQIVMIPRTEGISSTMLKKQITEMR